MRKYQFCLSAISCLFIVACSTYSPSKYTMENDPIKGKTDYNSIRSLYCSGEKKVKDFKFQFVDKDLKIQKGIPTSKAARIQGYHQNERSCRYKSTIYELTQTPSLTFQYQEVSQETFDEIEKMGMGTVGEFSNCRLVNIFVQSPNQKINNYPANVCSSGSGSDFISESDMSFNSFNSYSLKLPFITKLVESSTIIEPVEFQSKTYGAIAEQSSIEDSCQQDFEKVFGFDSDGKFSSEKAIEEKNQIWKRYITHFTSIKEVQVEDGVKVELTLDMTGFCKYGRSREDLISK